MPPAGPAMQPDMPPDMGMPPGPEMGGDVMISVPKGAFDALIQVVDQLHSGLKELSAGFEQQKAEAEGMEEGMETGMEEGMGAPSADDEFLASMVAESGGRPR